MASYPKWLYHSAKAPVLVKDEAEHKALGAEWFESPADVKSLSEPSTVKGEHKLDASDPRHQAVEDAVREAIRTGKPQDIKHPVPKKAK